MEQLIEVFHSIVENPPIQTKRNEADHYEPKQGMFDDFHNTPPFCTLQKMGGSASAGPFGYRTCFLQILYRFHIQLHFYKTMRNNFHT
jgi:hypothetical protein